MKLANGSPTPDLLTPKGQPTNPQSDPHTEQPLERKGSRARQRMVLSAVEPLAVSADEAAALCGIGKSLWHELDAVGRIPAPIKLGARCVWPVAELRAWLEAGGPPRSQWENIKNTTNNAPSRLATRGRGTLQN